MLAIIFAAAIHNQTLSRMNKLPLTLLFVSLFCLLGLAPSSTYAAAAISNDEMRAGFVEKLSESSVLHSKTLDKKTEKRLQRLSKKIERKAAKQGMQVDFSDPVEQWLWFGLFGLGIAIVLSFFNFGIAGLIALLAVACLVVWVIKRGAL